MLLFFIYLYLNVRYFNPICTKSDWKIIKKNL